MMLKLRWLLCMVWVHQVGRLSATEPAAMVTAAAGGVSYVNCVLKTT